jgi:hypothetical protein
VVQINDLIVPTADPRLPFGGRRSSGFGVTRGREGLLEMTVPHVVIRRSGRWRPHFASPRNRDSGKFVALIRLLHSGTLRERLKALSAIIGYFRTRRRAPLTEPSINQRPQ